MQCRQKIFLEVLIHLLAGLFFLIAPRRHHYTSWLCLLPNVSQASYGPASVSFPARGTFSSLNLSRFFSNNGSEEAPIIASMPGLHGSFSGVFGENAMQEVFFSQCER